MTRNTPFPLVILTLAVLVAGPARAVDVSVLEQAQLWGVSTDGIAENPLFAVNYQPQQNTSTSPGLSFTMPTYQDYSLQFPSLAGYLGAQDGSLTRSFSDNILQPALLGVFQEGASIFQSGVSVLGVTTDLAYGYVSPGQAMQGYGQALWNVLPGTGYLNFAADAGNAALNIQGATPPPQGQTSFTQPDQPPCTFEFCF